MLWLWTERDDEVEGEASGEEAENPLFRRVLFHLGNSANRWVSSGAQPFSNMGQWSIRMSYVAHLSTQYGRP